MSRLQDLETALRAADAAGNTEDATRLAQALHAERTKEPSFSHAGSVPLRVPFTDIGVDVPVPREVESTIIGLGRGVNNVWDGARDLGYRMTERTGTNEHKDALDKLNDDADAERDNFNRDFDGDYYAKGGEIAGEVIATAPLGGVVAHAGKGALAAGRTTRLAATEGFLAEGLTRRGDAGERLSAAGMGAVGGSVGDLAMKGISKTVAARGRHFDSKGIRRKHADMGDEADALQKQAADDGGYNLDRVDATKSGYVERDAARGIDVYDESKKQLHSDIINKAESFVPEDSRAMVGSAAEMREKTADDLLGALKDRKNYSEAEVDAFYEDWRMSMGDEKVPLPGLEEKLSKFLEDGILNADKGTGDGIREVLTKYGMLGNPESAIRDAAGNPIAQGGFTVGQIEKVRQELNAYYTPGLSRTSKKAIEEAKGIVDEHVSLHAFQNISKEGTDTLYKGYKATEGYKIHQATWGDKTFLGKLTKAGIDGEGFATAPTASLRKLLNADNYADLEKMKRVMEFGTAAQQKAWKNVTELPLLEALEAGLKGNASELNIGAFERALPKSPKARKILWGSKADDIDKALRAWKLNGTKPPAKGNLNTSNTAMLHDATSVGARIGAASGAFGRVGQLMLAIPSMLKLVKGSVNKSMRAMDAQRLANGQLPQAAEERLIQKMNAELKEAYGSPDIGKFDNAINFFIRNTIRESITEE